MSYISNIFSWLWHLIYFIFAHLPARIIANILLYLAILSLLLHFTSYYIEQHPKKIEQFVKQYLLMNIKFSTAKVDYNLLKPSITLNDLRIFESLQNTIEDENKQLHFNSASISINLLQSLLFLKPDIEFIHLDGFKTAITVHQDKSISIGSLKLQSIANDSKNTSLIPLWILRLKSFSLKNAQIIVNDKNRGIKNYTFDNIHIKMTNKNQWTHRLSVSAENIHHDINNLPVSFDKISLTSQFKGSIYNLNEWDGKFFIDIQNLKYKRNQAIAEFVQTISDIDILKGVFSGKLWGTFSQSYITELIAKIQLNDLVLQNDSNHQKLQISQFSSLIKLNENKHFLQSSQGNKLTIKNWLVSLYQLNIKTPLHDAAQSSLSLPFIYLNILKKSKLFEIKSYIDELQLDGLDDLLNFANSDLAQSYQSIKPRGSVSHFNSQFTVESKQIKKFQIYSKLNRISVSAFQEVPQFKNLSAKLWFDNQHGFIDL
ncbi:MAG: hypothetical protein QM504_04515, partial [Pseudomonadota bacterium]